MVQGQVRKYVHMLRNSFWKLREAMMVLKWKTEDRKAVKTFNLWQLVQNVKKLKKIKHSFHTTWIKCIYYSNIDSNQLSFSKTLIFGIHLLTSVLQNVKQNPLEKFEEKIHSLYLIHAMTVNNKLHLLISQF